MSTDKFLTPTSDYSGTLCRYIAIPDGEEWLALVLGALLSLCDPENFEQYGTALTPEYVAETFFAMWRALDNDEVC